MNIHRMYRRRQLGPFEGLVIQLDADFGYAQSFDSVEWRIFTAYMQRPHVPHRQQYGTGGQQAFYAIGPFAPHDAYIQYALYGKWSSKAGLTRYPMELALPIAEMQFQGQRLTEHLLTADLERDFPHLDHYELWSLDSANQPACLLRSALDPPHLDATKHGHPEAWTGFARGDLSFRSNTLSAMQPKVTQHHHIWLEQRINAALPSPAKAQWFVRHTDGSAEGLVAINVEDSLHRRELTSEDFPELLLKTHWEDPILTQVVSEFLLARSPWLLCLGQMSDSTRAELEKAARHYPAEVKMLYKTYPKIIDQNLLTKMDAVC